MFSQFTKYSLWNMQSDTIKIKDADTTQLMYEGEYRGQTQRFMIVIGSMLLDFFEKVESIFDWGNIAAHPDAFLDRLLALYNMDVFSGAASVGVKREILDEIITFWKMRGVYLALRWITYKAFGWEVTSVVSLEDLILETNISGSTLYNSSLPLEDNRVLFSSRLIDWPEQIVEVDVKDDADFWTKKIVFERLCDIWGYTNISLISYVNFPGELFGLSSAEATVDADIDVTPA